MNDPKSILWFIGIVIVLGLALGGWFDRQPGARDGGTQSCNEYLVGYDHSVICK